MASCVKSGCSCGASFGMCLAISRGFSKKRQHKYNRVSINGNKKSRISKSAKDSTANPGRNKATLNLISASSNVISISAQKLNLQYLASGLTFPVSTATTDHQIDTPSVPGGSGSLNSPIDIEEIESDDDGVLYTPADLKGCRDEELEEMRKERDQARIRQALMEDKYYAEQTERKRLEIKHAKMERDLEVKHKGQNEIYERKIDFYKECKGRDREEYEYAKQSWTLARENLLKEVEQVKGQLNQANADNKGLERDYNALKTKWDTIKGLMD
ncbi:uncharacterized protein I303_103014 [Kwoniella dejecticola CBS 10117]|uniref:Uncharacterized protein n=1 Tax=Kwoniella dejecticola CBS 10117 TaxID=1296121 RepID=A0A1A6AAC7_9TREE|nr:uncharacterized protein I303_03033 [Kwoniella dejecticola CBS 10117]OBR87011.1 hypothetical protein I303_03033 [Kwoniella dejecticola CBS 10117]